MTTSAALARRSRMPAQIWEDSRSCRRRSSWDYVNDFWDERIVRSTAGFRAGRVDS
jgi:hypothetical protein